MPYWRFHTESYDIDPIRNDLAARGVCFDPASDRVVFAEGPGGIALAGEGPTIIAEINESLADEFGDQQLKEWPDYSPEEQDQILSWAAHTPSWIEEGKFEEWEHIAEGIPDSFYR